MIQKVNGQTVTTNDEVVKAIKATKPGSTISMQIWSGGVKKLVTIKVEERPADPTALLPQPQQQQQQGQDPNDQQP